MIGISEYFGVPRVCSSVSGSEVIYGLQFGSHIVKVNQLQIYYLVSPSMALWLYRPHASLAIHVDILNYDRAYWVNGLCSLVLFQTCWQV